MYEYLFIVIYSLVTLQSNMSRGYQETGYPVVFFILNNYSVYEIHKFEFKVS